MYSTKKYTGKHAARGNYVPSFSPSRGDECPQEEMDEWLNCNTPQNDAAARAIIREDRREKSRHRRVRLKISRNSGSQARKPSGSEPSPYALPQLAKRVAEMDAIREQRGNPFPYPANRRKPHLAVFPEPSFQQPVRSHSSREEAKYPQRRVSPPVSRSSKTYTSQTPSSHKSRAPNAGQQQRIYLRIPRQQKARSPSIDVPVNASGHYGNIAGEDEIGVIYDYSNLLQNKKGYSTVSQDTGRQRDNNKNYHQSQEYLDTEDEDCNENSEEDENSEVDPDGGISEDDQYGREYSNEISEDIGSEPETDGTEGQGGASDNENDELIRYSEGSEEGLRFEMGNLPAGAEDRLRQLEEDEENGFPVNRSNSNARAWVSANDPRMMPNAMSQMSSNTGSNSYATLGPDRYHAPAFAPWKQRQDPYQHQNENRNFQYSTAVPIAPQPAAWNTMPPPPLPHRRGGSSRSIAESSASRFQSYYGPEHGGLDVHAARNQALEGVFNSESVNRAVNSPRYEDGHPQMRTSRFDETIQQPMLKEQYFDDRFEDPRLRIDPNIRANFVPFSQLHASPQKRSAFEMQNHYLIASNKVTPISTVIGGESVTYTPKPMDERVYSLDRYGNYIGENQGEISKRAKHDHIQKVADRDREMVEANEAYQTLLAMTPEARTELLTRLRKPFVFYGAFGDDQEVMDEIPEVYTKAVSSVRVMNWMYTKSTYGQNDVDAAQASTSPTDSFSPFEGANDSPPPNDLGDLDDFAAGSPFIPLKGSVQSQVDRTEKYFRDAVFFGAEISKNQAFQDQNLVRPAIPGQSPILVSTDEPSPRREPSTIPRDYGSTDLSAQAPSTHGGSDSTTRAQYRFPQTRPGQSEHGQSSNVSSHEIDDPFTFDDSPEFQIPQDVDLSSKIDLTSQQEILYRVATNHSKKYGRVVLVRLHEPVKFTPGAIASRIFGGIVQEMQLFPVQRLAIIVFLHSAEAKAFLRHVKRTYEIGNAQEIRSLQIEAGWYKGSEKCSILPAQSNILRHHVAQSATRTLQLSHIDLIKSVTQISSELGSRLSKMLLKVILTKPKQRYLQEEQGRKAIVEFASVKDAIEARERLEAGTVTAYGSDVAYAVDPCALVAEEKAWCKCMGCQEQRASKA